MQRPDVAGAKCNKAPLAQGLIRSPPDGTKWSVTGSSSLAGQAPHRLEGLRFLAFRRESSVPHHLGSSLAYASLSSSGLPYRPTGGLWLSLLFLGVSPFREFRSFHSLGDLRRPQSFGSRSTGCLPVVPENAFELSPVYILEFVGQLLRLPQASPAFAGLA